MIQYTNNQLQIIIPHAAPKECRNHLIKALAATIRWNANDESKLIKDDEHLVVISELLSSLLEAD